LPIFHSFRAAGDEIAERPRRAKRFFATAPLARAEERFRRAFRGDDAKPVVEALEP
jgi:hypothetical protein